MKLLYALALAMLLTASVSFADGGPINRCQWWFETQPSDWYTICTYPDGTGNGLLDAYDRGVSGQNATVLVRVTYNGVAVPGVSPDRVRMVIPDRNCGEWIHADGPSDRNGFLRFTTSDFHIFGRGTDYEDAFFQFRYEDDSTYWQAGDAPMTFKLNITSPDFNGDRTVGLADVAMFSSMYYNGVYDHDCDLNGDHSEDIADVTLFASARGKSCP